MLREWTRLRLTRFWPAARPHSDSQPPTPRASQTYAVWYYYASNKLYLMSYKDAVKVRNMTHNKTVYFSVDTDAMPKGGVRGKGTATIVKDTWKALSISEKIIAKYLSDINSSMAKSMVGEVRKRSEVLVEVTPRFFSTWDFNKSKF